MKRHRRKHKDNYDGYPDDNVSEYDNGDDGVIHPKMSDEEATEHADRKEMYGH